MFITSRKKVVGDSSGNWIVQKRRHGRAPSIAAASTSDFGIACSPARKNRKLYDSCFHTAAITISAIAWSPSSRKFQSTPSCSSTNETMPTLGANMNIHTTPATAGATAYGQIRKVRYQPEPRITRSAQTASSSDSAIPTPATSAENTAVVQNDAM